MSIAADWPAPSGSDRALNTPSRAAATPTTRGYPRVIRSPAARGANARSGDFGTQLVRAVGPGRLVVDPPGHVGQRHRTQIAQPVRGVRAAQRLGVGGRQHAEAAV